jgi:hypothetical protein
MYEEDYAAVVAHDRAEHEIRECGRVIRRAQEVLRNPRYGQRVRAAALRRIVQAELSRAAWVVVLRG